MNTSRRFEHAINKLYKAFHSNTLHPECSQQCAVGNICDNTNAWRHLSDAHGSLRLNYIGLVHQNLGRTFNGYTPFQLLQIEAKFLKACGYELPLHYKNRKPNNPTDKDTLFNGLCAVIKYLCSLDGIDDITNYSTLFEFQDEPNASLVETT